MSKTPWITAKGKFQCRDRNAVLAYVKYIIGRDDIEMFRLDDNRKLLFLFGQNGSLVKYIMDLRELKVYSIPNLTEKSFIPMFKAI